MTAARELAERLAELGLPPADDRGRPVSFPALADRQGPAAILDLAAADSVRRPLRPLLSRYRPCETGDVPTEFYDEPLS